MNNDNQQPSGGPSHNDYEVLKRYGHLREYDMNTLSNQAWRDPVTGKTEIKVDCQYTEPTFEEWKTRIQNHDE